MGKDVVMPALEMAQDRGTLLRWLKEAGDLVEKGEPLMEIETDKADIEIEAPASGRLTDVTAQPGDEVPVGQVIARIVPPESPQQQAAATPQAVRPASNQPAASSSDTVVAARPQAKVSGSKALPSDGPLASPKAKRLAAEANLDLSRVVGSGPRGSILASDVLANAKRGAGAPQQAEYAVVPVQGMRRVVAERLQSSHQQAPVISLTLSIDMSAAQRWLRELKAKAAAADARTPGMTALISKAAGAALLRCPRLNSHYVNDEIREFHAVHLGIAVALDDGLVVAVARNVQSKGLAELQTEIDDLTSRARHGRLKPEQFTGSTFTVTNLGMYGIEQFSAILNPPEVGILSVGMIREAPAAQSDGSLGLSPLMQVTINADHRAVDGAVGARFLATLKALLEDPAQLLA